MNDKIKAILDQSTGIPVKTYEGLFSTFVLNEGASLEEIAVCNSYFNSGLPVAYKTFLKHFNGGALFKVDDIAGYKFLGCDEIIMENKRQKESYGSDWNDDILLICCCLGDGDYIGIKSLDDHTYEIIDCYHEELPAEWKSITPSLDIFLEKLMAEKGRKFWLFE